MNEIVVAAALAAVLAVVFEVSPGLAQAWDKVPYKRWIVLGLCLVLPLAAQIGACYGIDLRMHATCDYGLTAQVIIDTLFMGLMAFLGSQAGYVMANNGADPISLRAQLKAAAQVKTDPPNVVA